MVKTAILEVYEKYLKKAAKKDKHLKNYYKKVLKERRAEKTGLISLSRFVNKVVGCLC